MQETLYFLQVFAIHLFCAAVGIANVVSTYCLFAGDLEDPETPWLKLFIEAALTATTVGIYFQGDWYQNGSMLTGIFAGIVLVCVWRKK